MGVREGQGRWVPRDCPPPICLDLRMNSHWLNTHPPPKDLSTNAPLHSFQGPN